MKKAIITGISGQDGILLTDFLFKKEYAILGITPFILTKPEDFQYFRAKNVQLIDSDKMTPKGIDEIISTYKPNEFYNLAAQSFEPYCWNDPIYACDLMGLNVVRILESIKSSNPTTRFFQASSSEMFGIPVESPQTEKTPLCPINLYGNIKEFSHRLVGIYRSKYGIFACSGILYNHESTLRRHEFVTRKISNTAAQIKCGCVNELRLGSLDSYRDWSFAGDFVEAFWLMLQTDEPDDYILASGIQHSVREFCEIAFNRLGLSYSDYVIEDPKFIRQSNNKFIGDISKASSKLDWKPKISFENLVLMMVDHDLNQIKKQQLK